MNSLFIEAESFKNKYNIEKAFDDFSEMLKSDYSCITDIAYSLGYLSGSKNPIVISGLVIFD